MDEIEKLVDALPPAPKKKRPYHRRRAPLPPKPPKPEPVSIYAGASEKNCCAACTPIECVISGRAVCAHPYKGGLRAGDSGKAELVKRVLECKEYIRRGGE